MKYCNALLNIITVTFCCICCANHTIAQVKYGDNKAVINPNSILELETTNKGILLPRIALTSTASASPLTAFVAGMFIFNNATAGDVTPGIYYSDGVKWIKVTTGSDSKDNWGIQGNSGTNGTTNFLGTNDNNPLVMRTNGREQLRVTEIGRLGIGTAAPLAALHVRGQVVIDTLTVGDKTTDSLLVSNPANGKIKMISTANFLSGAQKTLEVVATTGQVIFNTPLPIADINKILLYRNGVLIAFSVNNSSSIIAEISCVAGDEIRIVQFL